MKSLYMLLLICFTALNVAAQDDAPKPDDEKFPAAKDAAAMIQTTNAQSDEHLLLKQLLGRWSLTSVDGVKSQQSGHTHFRSIAFGNFVAEEAVGFRLFIEEDFLFGGPQLGLVSHGVYGFDPLTRKYTAIWYTNFNTIAFQGIADVEPDQQRLHFKISHPLFSKIAEAAEVKRAFAYRITFADDDHLRMEFLETRSDEKATTRLFGVSATKVEPQSRNSVLSKTGDIETYQKPTRATSR